MDNVTNRPPTSVPYQSGELQNTGQRQAPQNTNETAELEFVIVSGQTAVAQSQADFGSYLNQMQTITELRAKVDQGLVYDPVRDLEQQSVLQGPRTQGDEPF